MAFLTKSIIYQFTSSRSRSLELTGGYGMSTLFSGTGVFYQLGNLDSQLFSSAFIPSAQNPMTYLARFISSSRRISVVRVEPINDFHVGYGPTRFSRPSHPYIIGDLVVEVFSWVNCMSIVSSRGHPFSHFTFNFSFHSHLERRSIRWITLFHSIPSLQRFRTELLKPFGYLSSVRMKMIVCVFHHASQVPSFLPSLSDVRN
ncbi:hypothetical protein C8J56DRAFT_936465 [Mycena floridula]|nr:hypothetical protein C8J56DRAFT_936465 [Mycena floridula]